MQDTHHRDSIALTSFGTNINAAIVGATGGIGSGFAHHLCHCGAVANLVQLARSVPHDRANNADWFAIDLEDEDSIKLASDTIKRGVGELHLVIVATGILHNGEDLKPEKTWREVSGPAMASAFQLNTIGPALVAKHFLPLLAKDRKSVFSALSARVGSIEDNRLGGWHAYRASKAALNMVIKTLSIELARRNPNALCVGLHPGTVDTRLSKPFQRGVAPERLFSPADSAKYLLNVLDRLTPEDSGHVYAWDGVRIPA